MGIPAYFSHIIKSYPAILKNLKYYAQTNTRFDSLYMDCNSIIYDSLRNITEKTDNIEQVLIDHVKRQIEMYVNIVKPNNVLFIAFDGVAPLAKMEQQRQRRYKSVFMHGVTSAISSDNNNITQSSASACSDWNTNAITPGTKFMQKLSEQIKYAFHHSESKYRVKKVIVSTSDEPGEGEHKMFHHIRTNLQPTDNIVVYGLDSDLIMLSLFHYNLCNNIFIFKETPEYMKKSPDDCYTILDIQQLFQSIVLEMACDRDKNRAYDYIFLCFFIGNDFLPHFPSLNIRTNGIQVLLDAYRRVIGKSPDNFIISKVSGKIQWKYVDKLVRELLKYEKNGFIQNDKHKEKLEKMKYSLKTPKEKMELIENTPIFYRHLEKYICPEEIGWEDRYYKALFHCERNEESKKRISMNYLEGLEWTFKYYTEGCPDWRWKYNYHFPPLFTDLANYIPHFETDFIAYNENLPFLPNVQLAYVLPKESHSLMEDDVVHVLNTHFSKFYTKEVNFQWAYCRYLWESHLILPDIPIEILHRWNSIFR